MRRSTALLAKGSPILPVGRRRWLFLLPVAGFLSLTTAFALRIGKDPSIVPSPLLGRSVPSFHLPPVQGRTLGLSTGDLKGAVSLVNVFASWCGACREEHPLLVRLKQEGAVPVHGLDDKDRPDDAARRLDTMGDPYARTGADRDGRVAIDWGVYGVPETFVAARNGRIAYKHTGPISPQALSRIILPLIAELREERPAAAAGPH